MAYKVGKSRLRKLLKEKGMEQTALAKALYVTPQQINKYVLNKQKMSLEVAKNVSVILGCTIDELYEWVIYEVDLEE